MSTRGEQQRSLGGVLVAAGVAGILAVLAIDPEPPGTALALMGIAIALVAYGVVLLQRGRKLGQPMAAEQQAADPRPPVVYLRAFSSDSKSAFADAFQNRAEFLPMKFGWMLPDDMHKGFAAAMNRIGPFVALGRPGEQLPPFGAARRYVSDDMWRSEVDSWIRRAAIVVILARPPKGAGGFDWELRELVRLNRPTRILLVCAAVASEHARFKQLADAVIPRPLPSEAPRTRLLAFRADWEPYPLLPVSAKGDRSEPWDLLSTLRPMLEANRLEVAGQAAARDGSAQRTA